MSIFVILISLVIWGLIFWLLYWFKSQIAIPEPWNKGLTVLLALAAVIIIIGLLSGHIAPFHWLSSERW